MAEKIMVLNGAAGLRRFELKIDGTVHKIKLVPGPNLLDKKVSDTLFNTYPQQTSAWGITVVASVSKKGKTEPTLGDFDITKVSAKEAQTTIKATSDVDALKAWKSQEENNPRDEGARSTVIKALEKQIEIASISLESQEEKKEN